MKKFAAIIATSIIAGVLILTLSSHWFAARMVQDFWPIDSSRVGPNLVASVVQWIIVAIVASIVYPPFRNWIEREINKIHEKLDKNALLSHHIIKHHPEIPKFKEEKEQ